MRLVGLPVTVLILRIGKFEKALSKDESIFRKQEISSRVQNLMADSHVYPFLWLDVCARNEGLMKPAYSKHHTVLTIARN